MLKLHDFQFEGIDFLVDRLTADKGGGLLADLGIGKTAIMLRAIEKLLSTGQIKRCLVLAPMRVIENTWPEQIVKWTPRLTHQSIHGFRYDLHKLPRRDIEFQSSDSVHKLVEYAGRWDLVIVDESHNFKAWTRRRMRSLRHILKETPRRIIATATPALVDLGDLHAQIYILDDGEALGKNVTVFRAVYMERHGYMNRQWRIKPGMQRQLLEKISHLVMRIDAATHLDMPKLIEHNIDVSMPDSIRAEYNTLKRKLYIELRDNPQPLLVGNAAALYTKLRQYACGQLYIPTGEVRITKSGKKIKITESHIVHDAKISALKETVDSLCGKPAMILYQYTHDCARIVEALGGKRCRVLSSGMPTPRECANPQEHETDSLRLQQESTVLGQMSVGMP